MDMVEPAFLAVTITPSMLPSWVEDTVPVRAAAGAWAVAPLTFKSAAAATADKSVVMVFPDIGPSLAGRGKIVKRIQPLTIHKAASRRKREEIGNRLSSP